MSDITFKLTVATNVGKVRTNNEDNFIVSSNLDDDNWYIPRNTNTVLDLEGNGCVLVVADGMGGMNAGEVASEIAVDTIREVFSKAKLSKIRKSVRNIENFLRKAIVIADSNIKSRVKDDCATKGMGTTIVVAWVVDDSVCVSWCGDSRAYCYNPASGLKRLTKDHSYVQQLVDEGKLDPELAFDHPNSNIITRSLGDSPASASPDFVKQKLMKGDIILLCSDGLCGICRDEQILSVIENSDSNDIEDIKSNLISAALDEGGYDNVTVALFQCVTAAEDELHKTINTFERRSGKCVAIEKKEKSVSEENEKKEEPDTGLSSEEPVDNDGESSKDEDTKDCRNVEETMANLPKSNWRISTRFIALLIIIAVILILLYLHYKSII